MDSMDLEREKGITIQSAATFCQWKGKDINIIDTPGHVDFTIEVERALRVLDGAVLVLCGVGGVQSQTVTVDRQMRRYGVPRVAFINKLDRPGADPAKVIEQLRQKLRLNAAAVALPLGLDSASAELTGIADVVRGVALRFEGPAGETVVEEEIDPSSKEGKALEEARAALVEAVADADDELAELFLEAADGASSLEKIPPQQLSAAIRRATISLKFVPVFAGSAYKNKGVQTLLDGVAAFLPAPGDVPNTALDLDQGEKPVDLPCDPEGPLVALAFKLEEGRFGQLTYLRVYSGRLAKGDSVLNVATGKRVKVPRLVRMHSDEMVDAPSASAGDIVAVFGVDCSSGDTFVGGSGSGGGGAGGGGAGGTTATRRLSLTSMNVPEPVMSLAVSPTTREGSGNFSKALARFQREDPTFRVSTDPDSGQTVISGMGELHLEVRSERGEEKKNPRKKTPKKKLTKIQKFKKNLSTFSRRSTSSG